MSHGCELNSRISRFRIDYLILFLVCTGIRVIHIDTFDLWGDEIYNFFSVNTFFLSVRKTPLYILVNLFYKSLVPDDVLYSYNFVPRIPALIFGILTVIVMYDGFKRFVGTVPAWMVAILACTAYPLVIYSRESRFYSMTHFFVATSLWYFLAILDNPSTRRMSGLTVAAIFGFLTYPYLTFSVCFLYLFVFIQIAFVDKRGDWKPFLLCFMIYMVVAVTFLVLMRGSFSSGAYTPISYSTSFFIYALKSAISYFSGNSYLITAIAFFFPLKNLFLALRRRQAFNYIYIWWLLCFSLVIAHIFIITFLTVNAFNPRHINFLAIPFLAAVSLGIYEIFEFARRYAYGKTTAFATLFLICLTTFVLFGRDFRFYMTTGRNYHAINRTDVRRTMRLVEKATRSCSKYILFYVNNEPDSDYLFYHYRSGRQIVDWKKHDDIIKNVNLSESMCLGFVVFNTGADNLNGAAMEQLRHDMDTYSSGDAEVFITRREVYGNQIRRYLSIIKKLLNR